MNIERLRWIGAMALAGSAALLLTGCETGINAPPGAASFGEPNRQTMMAQVIDPDPQYDEPLASSGEHAAQAIERYRTDKVKQPPKTTSTRVSGSSGN